MFVWPSARMPAIWPCRSPMPPSGWRPDDPVGRLVEADDAELVALGQGRGGAQDRLLADVDLLDAADPAPAAHPAVEGVAVAGRHRAGLVDDDDERDVGLLLAVAHAHVDRQRLLERRLLVAAGAVALRAADHHQALAEIADVDLERRQLPVAQAQPRDVDEDDAVVAGEAREVGRQRLGHDRVDLLALVLERRDELGGDRVVARQHERPRLALDDRVRVGAVVLAERVARRLDDGPEGVEAGLGRLDVERDPGDAGARARPAGSPPAPRRRTGGRSRSGRRSSGSRPRPGSTRRAAPSTAWSAAR